ncbi:tRNA (adenosine(37)-N6)-threonylcarbamoyltransferase complex ATPase subunit type 1 TsaE [Thermosynechococcaceae cyanobacterium BACA0444]|uniref:tRNA threonylcarbamoyladenosine biosynthesis protein TsaE n=1 Tax=Pseudocalidococcus azoricus BACA0444 TaxID=2918990 RepID=A0AAE4FT84_9CYAN|nr:tRNA (adenosine(37)-N6)-threonylcarbamoyltransferase complex ATPase subunit type 1 TsaE [Pseudocalidococcus azoricus]MDS3861112.1 tRNA (adenosine(37)-N6)-threonylcarbamoyltransferase complex ATPase subunit type 1 TsaE [Pseudocalidococcus azoricus BACA0444]
MALPDLALSLTPIPLTQAELQALAQSWGENLPAGTTILLNGDLGSGKTTFVQGLGLGLGISDPIVSPTFTLIQEYFEGRLPLYHFDLYRLSEPEILALHPEVYWQGADVPLGLVAIEWPKTLRQLFPIPGPVIELQLTTLDEGQRALAWQVITA